MHKYVQLFKLSLSDALQYRANVFLEMAGTAVLMFFTVALWKALFNAAAGAEIRG